MIWFLIAAAVVTTKPKSVVRVWPAEIVKVVDGDTVRVNIARWPEPFTPVDIRIKGIDTPEHDMLHAQTRCEVALGRAAQDFGRAMAKPGDKVKVIWIVGDQDKYGRILGTIKLADGREWGSTLISAGLARPYGVNGDLHKQIWCQDPVPDAQPLEPQ